MRWLIPIMVIALCALGMTSSILGCDGDADADADADADGDGDGDCDLGQEDETCLDDDDCCSGLSCHIVDMEARVPVCVVCQEEGEGCNMSTECCRGNVCVEHRCVPSCPRSYEFSVSSASIYPRKTGGYLWDHEEPEADQDPDPYAYITVGDTEFTTTVKENNINPIWAETFIAHVECQTYYSIELFDEDGEEDETILEFGTDGFFWLTDWDLRQGGMRISQGSEGQRNTISLTLDPQ